MIITYTRHLTQREKNKQWIDGELKIVDNKARLTDENGYILVNGVGKSSIRHEKDGRYFIGNYLVDIDDDDLNEFNKWRISSGSNSASVDTNNSNTFKRFAPTPFNPPLVRKIQVEKQQQLFNERDHINKRGLRQPLGRFRST